MFGTEKSYRILYLFISECSRCDRTVFSYIQNFIIFGWKLFFLWGDRRHCWWVDGRESNFYQLQSAQPPRDRIIFFIFSHFLILKISLDLGRCNYFGILTLEFPPPSSFHLLMYSSILKSSRCGKTCLLISIFEGVYLFCGGDSRQFYVGGWSGDSSPALSTTPNQPSGLYSPYLPNY